MHCVSRSDDGAFPDTCTRSVAVEAELVRRGLTWKQIEPFAQRMMSSRVYIGYEQMLQALDYYDGLTATNRPYFSVFKSTLAVVESWTHAKLSPLRRQQKPALSSLLVEGRAYSGLIDAPPGWGKTTVLMHFLQAVKRRAVVVSTTKLLLVQWRDLLAQAGVTSLIVGENRDSQRLNYFSAPDVILITYSGLINQKGSESAHDLLVIGALEFGVMILDEVHVLPAARYRSIISENDKIRALCKVGCTGTMVREDGLIGDLTQLVGPYLFRVRRNTHLNAPAIFSKVVVVPAPERMDEFHGMEKRLLTLLNPHKIRVLLSTISAHATEKVFVFCNLVFGIEALAKVLDHVGQAYIGPITGKSYLERRERALQDFRSASSGVLLATDVLALGVDVEDVSCVIELGVDISRSKCVQRQGRSWRVHEGKTKAYCYTLVTQSSADEDAIHHRASLMVHSPSVERITADDGGSVPVVDGGVESIVHAEIKRSSQIQADIAIEQERAAQQREHKKRRKRLQQVLRVSKHRRQ